MPAELQQYCWASSHMAWPAKLESLEFGLRQKATNARNFLGADFLTSIFPPQNSAAHFSRTIQPNGRPSEPKTIGNVADQSVTPKDIELSAFKHTRSFISAKTAAIAAAPDPEMKRMIAADGALLRQLRIESIDACAQHAMHGMQPGTKPSPTALALVDRSSANRIRAARAGEQRPTKRSQPSEKDLEAWVVAMYASGASETALDAFFSGSAENQSAQTQCDATIAMYDALEAMPLDQAGRVYALILIEAEKAQAAQ